MLDAIVIGAGAGGAAAAWRLATRGARVLLLDAGPWFDPARDYGLDQPDWELRPFPIKPGSQGRHVIAPLQTLDPRWDDLRSRLVGYGPMVQGTQRMAGGYQHVRGIGGSTLHYVGEAHRLHPRSLRLASEHGVGADWPLDYAELEPYYVEAERLIGVAGAHDGPLGQPGGGAASAHGAANGAATGAVPGSGAGSDAPHSAAESSDGDPSGRWRSAPYPLPAHPFNAASRALAAGAARLGWHWQANPRAALSAPYGGRPPCNYCGACSRGCPRRDKGSADQTWIPAALATGRLEIRDRATVVGLLHGSRRQVDGVRYIDARGKARTERARLVVLACGAVDTPRLLLTQRSRLAPQGIGNDHGQVGRHFMETLFWTSIALHPQPLHSHAGLPADSVCWDFNAPDALPQDDGPLIGGVRFFNATQDVDLLGPVAYATRLVRGWGRDHKRRLRAALGHALAVGAIGESLPHAGSRVDLDPSERDAHGLPLARIHSQLDDMACRRLRFMAQGCRRLLAAAGCGEVLQEMSAWDTFASTHVFGTCRMGRDPDSSVVDARQRVHGWGNLLIADASVFPSSGGGESPSLTIHALALRAVDAALAVG